ncbi:phage tail spike protein, partial [Thermaerobacillus caldiproteolyticus]|uniref:phage tail spike protein n=1 Tax=Thermaerobacillus caldiproteolyticus TaxID=247480 RepID=UPI0018F1FD26
MALVHILDKQTDEIIGTLDIGEYTDAVRRSSLDNKNQFDFTALKDFDKLEKRNRVLVQDADGFFHEYIITFAEQRDRYQKHIMADASFVDLAKAKVIPPTTLQGATPYTAAEYALANTEWQVGDIDFTSTQTITLNDYTNPYDLLKQIASIFGLELRFRVEVSGNRIVGRYVDLKQQIAGFEGKEIEFGKDLIGINRKEDNSQIVTALLGVGPKREDGTRLTYLATDADALQRWGRNGKHLIEVYEPESADINMTLEQLRELTEAELKKRIDAIVTYEGTAAAIEHIPGLSHEKIRLGQTVRIKDTGYTPPLYVEARIQEVEEDPATRRVLSFKIGNFVEYKKEDLEAQIKLLKELMKQKASSADVQQALEYAEQKAQEAETNAKQYADSQDVTLYEDVTYYADQVASTAENNAKQAVQNGEVPIPASAVLGELELANTVLKNANSTVFSDQNGNLYFIDPNNPNLVVKITSNGIAVGKNGVNGAFATAITGNGIIADLITSGIINTDLVRIANDRVTIDKNGVTVKQADFLIEDPITNVKISIVKKTNLVQDHSFEMFDADASDNPVDISRYPEDVFYKWKIFGSPKLLSDKYSEIENSYHPIFGANTAVVHRGASFEQWIAVKSNTTYTLSAFFRTSMKYNPAGAGPRLHIEFLDANLNSIGGASQDFPTTPANNPTVIRHAKTFTTPSTARYVRILPLSTVNGSWIEADGMQLVEGDKPVTYDPEDKLWQMRTGFREKFYSVYSPVFNSVAVKYLGLEDKTVSQANGFLALRSLNDRIYLQSPIEIRAVKPYTT